MSPKRHHFVPQFYLSYFAVPPDKGQKPSVWVYDKKGGPPRAQTLQNTAVEGHLYTFDWPDGERDTRLEQIFAELESRVKPILDRLRSPSARPTPHDIPHIADFLATMYIRVPRTMRLVKDIGIGVLRAHVGRVARNQEELKKLWDDITKGETVEGLSFEEFQVELLKLEKNSKITVNPKAALVLSMKQAEAIYRELLRMNWCLCRAPENTYLITSDSPVTVFVPDGAKGTYGTGFELTAVEVSFPISPEVCLYLHRGINLGSQIVGKPSIREINRRTAMMAERFVISSHNSREVQELITKA